MMKTLSIEDACWLAGFFDGEGSVHIEPRHFRPRVQVAQKDPSILYWMVDNFGGHVREFRTVGRVDSNGERRLTHIWQLAKKKDVENFCRLLAPYCKIKGERLTLAAESASLHSSEKHRLHEIYKHVSSLRTGVKRGRKPNQ